MVERNNDSIDPESQTTKRVEAEFPNDPEERYGALLASFNIGPKAATLLLLPRDLQSYISPEDLARKFSEVIITSAMAGVKPVTSAAYCSNTLCPIGLVAKEYVIDYFGREELAGFGLTEAGQKYGLAAACLALDFENRHKFSLFPILGSTVTSSKEGTRAPLTRARILTLLSRTPELLREVEISKDTSFAL